MRTVATRLQDVAELGKHPARRHRKQDLEIFHTGVLVRNAWTLARCVAREYRSVAAQGTESTTMSVESNPRLTSLRIRWLGPVSAAVGITVVVLSALGAFVEWRIERRLLQPDLAREIAARIRPALIFDANETILADQGAGSYIESIRVTSEESGLTKIVVTPRRHLASAPWLDCLSQPGAQVRWERGHGHDWIYEVSYLAYIGEAEPEGWGPLPSRYRLEVLLEPPSR